MQTCACLHLVQKKSVIFLQTWFNLSHAVRFLRLDDLEFFLEDAERAAAADDQSDADNPEDRLGEGNHQSCHTLCHISSYDCVLLSSCSLEPCCNA